MKSGFVTLIGRTNVGKSTLLNMLIGQKIAAVANSVQTTRYAIKGILNTKNSQIIFTDTPGIHKPKTKLSETMVETSYQSIPDADLVIFMADATSTGVGPGDRLIIEKIKERKQKAILLLNKVDLARKDRLKRLIEMFKKEYDFLQIIPISANDEKYREVVISAIEENLSERPIYYDFDSYTDQTIRQLAEEIIREKALILLKDEVPHGLYIEVDKVEETTNVHGKELYIISATINCIRKSHKPIILGKDGANINKLKTMSRYEMEKAFGTKVKLDLWVKVNENWNEKDSIVNKFKLK